MVFVPAREKTRNAIAAAMAPTARDVLNELRWREPSRLAAAVVWYRDRTRGEGYRVIRGSDIVDLERRYFTTGAARLPYYKVERIECDGKVLFARTTGSSGDRALPRG